MKNGLSVVGFCRLCAFALVGLVVFQQGVYAQSLLPSTGIDVSDYIGEAITMMATIVGAVIGGYIVWCVIWKGMRYTRRAL